MTEPDPDRALPPRTPLTPTILSITLGLEGFVVFFAALTAFGLRRLDMAPAFIGGAILMLAFFVTAGMVRRSVRAPSFALTVLLLVGAVVAVNATAFAALHALRWKALPYPQAGQLVELKGRRHG